MNGGGSMTWEGVRRCACGSCGGSSSGGRVAKGGEGEMGCSFSSIYYLTCWRLCSSSCLFLLVVLVARFLLDLGDAVVKQKGWSRDDTPRWLQGVCNAVRPNHAW